MGTPASLVDVEMQQSLRVADLNGRRVAVKLSQPGVLELVNRATDAEGHAGPEQREARRLDKYIQKSYHRVHVVV
jgi:hypothetical protein